MPGAKDENFDGLTIAYNGVQFGGGDSAFPSQPPQYRLAQRAVYDEAGRVITHIRYILTVLCTFYAADEATLSANLDAIKFRLNKAGEPLKLSGIGLGFIQATADMIWGPKPMSFDIVNTHGVIAVDTVWVVEFNGPPCVISNTGGLFFSAVNSESSYTNDFEGKTTRTISGYFEIPQTRSKGKHGDVVDATGSKRTLDRVADDLRDGVKIFIPFGFRRVTSTWRGNKARTRVDFTVIDEELPGRAYPVGITKITNDRFEFSTDPFTATQGTATLTATYTVSPKFSPSLAGLHFFALASFKQASMLKRINGIARADAATASVLPVRLVVSSGLYDSARTTSFAMQWVTTGCLSNILFHSPWEAIPGTNYNEWRQSINNLWGNTGNSGIRDNKNGDAIIRICDAEQTYPTGQQQVRADFKPPADISLLPCPKISKESSWISYDVQVQVFNKGNTSLWQKMVNVFSSFSLTTGIGSLTSGATSMTLGRPFSTTDDSADVVSQNGKPVQYILMQAKGRRVNFQPVFPQLKTVGGVKVRPIDPSKDLGFVPVGSRWQTSVVAKFGNCVINQMRGFQWYVAVDGKYIKNYEQKDNPVMCATTRESGPTV